MQEILGEHLPEPLQRKPLFKILVPPLSTLGDTNPPYSWSVLTITAFLSSLQILEAMFLFRWRLWNGWLLNSMCLPPIMCRISRSDVFSPHLSTKQAYLWNKVLCWSIEVTNSFTLPPIHLAALSCCHHSTLLFGGPPSISCELQICCSKKRPSRPTSRPTSHI